MKKAEKLSEVYHHAERVPFDNHSRLIFFSDVHRGDNSWADEFARNQVIYAYALAYYFQEGFTYIEVGDGDELLKNRNLVGIRTAHAPVYKLLRKFYRRGRFYYLHGNHDIHYRDQGYSRGCLSSLYNPYRDELEPLFPGLRVREGLVLVHQETGQDLFVVHGHQGEFLNDRAWQISQFLLRSIWKPLQLLGIQNPSRVSVNPQIRRKVEMELIAWSTDNDQALLCGHTHKASFPIPGEAAYFNTGSCVHPRWITGLEIDRGAVQLIRWRVKPDPLGHLSIQREVVSGPEPLAVFLGGASEPPEPELKPVDRSAESVLVAEDNYPVYR